MINLFHDFLNWTGANNVSGNQYGFWSGFGSDITEFAILGIVFKRVNCHAKGCHRIGLHHIEGTPYTVCKKHHPLIGGK